MYYHIYYSYTDNGHISYIIFIAHINTINYVMTVLVEAQKGIVEV